MIKVSDIRAGKTIFAFNAFSCGDPNNIEIDELHVTSDAKKDKYGTSFFADEYILGSNEPFNSEHYVLESSDRLQGMFFTKKAAYNALRNYQNSPKSQKTVKEHHDSCFDEFDGFNDFLFEDNNY